MMPDYLHNKPLDLLIDPALTVADFNDEILDRSLDDLYEAGVTKVFYKVAAQALQVYGLRPIFVYLDSSTLLLHGANNTEEPDQQAISITYDYSKEHCPDLKHVVVQIITSHKTALPVWLEVLNGNSNDKETFKAMVKAYFKQLNTNEQPYLVMESAGYSTDTMKEAQDVC